VDPEEVAVLLGLCALLFIALPLGIVGFFRHRKGAS
jgi:hypothetical protein